MTARKVSVHPVVAMGRKSVLKRAKVRELIRAMGDVQQRVCLDIGGDNGAVSAELRACGGQWRSADLGQANVEAIRAVVGDEVLEVVGSNLPFPERTFHLIVIADLLEHVDDDQRLIAECARILAPDGALIINVPHIKPRSIINRLRHLVGLTDAWHGHLRAGYNEAMLRSLLTPAFRVESVRTYSRTCSELIDIALNAVFLMAEGRRSGARPKGTVISSPSRTQTRLLSAAYPFLAAFSALDALLPLQAGYKLIVRARREGHT